MRNLAIEINEASIVVVDDSGVIRSEPGYARVEGSTIVTGAEAYAEARLKPRRTSWSHWSSLSIEAGSSSVSQRLSTAELAYAQLNEIWKAVGSDVDHVVFVVPSIYDGEALGVLLGLAEECGIPTGAIVDAAVAASARPYPDRQLVYVDADLHRVYVTPLEQGERVTAETPSMLESMGLGRLMDAFARRLGELFVLATRFDPFHEATTEQLVYAGLPGVIKQLDRGATASFAITHKDERFEIDIEPAQVLSAAQGFYRAVRQLIAQVRRDRPGLVVQLSDRLTALPSIEAELARLDATVLVELETGHAGKSVLAAAEALALESDTVRLFRHMPWRGEPVATELITAAVSESWVVPSDDYICPTHVVYRGVAYRVNGEGVVVGRSQLDHRRAILVQAEHQGVSRAHCELVVVDGELRLRDLSSYGTFVNERRVQGDEILKPADTIRVGSPGAELIVVRVEDSDGT